MNKRTGPKIQTKMYRNWPKEKKSQTANSDFHSNRKHKSQMMASTPWRQTTNWAGEQQLPYLVSMLTDCSQLMENITADYIINDYTLAHSWEIPVHLRTLGESPISVHNTARWIPTDVCGLRVVNKPLVICWFFSLGPAVGWQNTGL